MVTYSFFRVKASNYGLAEWVVVEYVPSRVHHRVQKQGREPLMSTHANSQPEVATRPQARSRLTNGSAVVLGVDGRGSWVRRKRDLIELHLSDLGGVANTSEAERAIVSLAATLRVELEQMDCVFAQAGGATERQLDAFGRHSSTYRRLMESLGLARRSRTVKGLPTLLGADD